MLFFNLAKRPKCHFVSDSIDDVNPPFVTSFSFNLHFFFSEKEKKIKRQQQRI